MSHLGDGYGSGFHLLRFLGRHRGFLDARMRELTGARRVDWLDFHFDRRESGPDAELRGLEFVDDPGARAAWRSFWPAQARAPLWDAVAALDGPQGRGWLLLDAWSHVDESRAYCSARVEVREALRAMLDHTKRWLDVPPEHDWLDGHYAYCLRLAVLAFLHQHGVPAHGVQVCFVGDDAPRRLCPESPDEWKESQEALDAWVGLPPGHRLERYAHTLFLPVCPEAAHD